MPHAPTPRPRADHPRPRADHPRPRRRAGTRAALFGVLALTVTLTAGSASAGATEYGGTTGVPATATTDAPATTTVTGDPLTGTGATQRTLLTAQDLLEPADGAAPTGTIPDSAFALPANAAMPRHVFSGRLELQDPYHVGGFTKLLDTFGILGRGEIVKHLPETPLELTQTGSHLVPAVQGIQVTGHGMWNLIVSPGRAWSETADGPWSRAAVPFTLVQRNANCAHVGTLTFLFDDTRVSQVRYQVTQETCPYFRFDLWGQGAATYTPYELPDADALRTAHAEEVAHRLPTRPISQLAPDHPEADVDLSAFGHGVTPEHLSAYGLLYEGVNYVSDCTTRQGTYPFCEVMMMSTYSVAKSVFAATAMMRLAHTHGPEVVDVPIGRWVPEATQQRTNGWGDPVPEQSTDDWADVTVGNLLDMASGHYASPEYLADENGPTVNSFVVLESHEARMREAFGFPRQAEPGTRWVYHTSDTFLATTALGNYLGSDLFDLVRDEVYAPAGLSRAASTTVRTDNSATGTPLGGYGLFLTRDDVAKLARLFSVDQGRIDGEQVLDPDLLAAAMQRDPEDRGLEIPDGNGSRYNNGLWATQITPERFPRYTCSFWLPFMSGYGGITVMMMPNGATYYVFSDNGEYDFLPAVHAADSLSPHCPTGR